MQAQAATYQSESLLFSILLQLAMMLMAIGSTFMTVPLIRVIYRRSGQLVPHGIEA